MEKEKEPSVDEMFGGDSADVDKLIGELAEHIAIEMEAVDELKKEHTRRKEALESAKDKLNHVLTEAGMKSCKLECGLNPAAKTDTKYYPVAGFNSEKFFSFLKDNNLADIIKPTVHFGTAQSTLKAFEEQGNEIPEAIVKKSLVYTIRMNGKAGYLAGRKS